MKIIDAEKFFEILNNRHMEALGYDGYCQAGFVVGIIKEAIKDSTVEATNISYIEPKPKGKIIEIR